MQTPTRGRLANSKRVLLFCSLLAGMLGGGIAALEYGVRHSTYAQTWKVNLVADHRIDPDVMVFGSSVAEVGINPTVLQDHLALSVFNCGIDGTRYEQYKGLVDEFAAYSKANRYVIMVETYFTFEPIDSLNAIERYMAHLDNDTIYRPLYEIQPDLTFKCRYVPFYKFVAASPAFYKNAAIGWRNVVNGTNLNCGISGQTAIDRSWDADCDAAIQAMKPYSIQVDSRLVHDYRLTLNELSKCGRRVVVVLPPINREVFPRLQNITRLRETLHSLESEPNVLFLDFSSSYISDHKEYFYNGLHLNCQGASVFSRELAESIKQSGILH